MEKCYGIILAAGEGKRMKSKLPKVLHEVCGKSMVGHVIDAVVSSGVDDFIVVVGHKAEIVKTHLGDTIKTAYQDRQLGTGHAVMCCEDFLRDKEGTVIILAGDAPLITSDTISKVFEFHNSNNFSATILTGDTDYPDGFGRIIRDASGEVERIVEHKDATEEERKVKEVNSGTYCFNIKHLLEALKNINNNNAQGEYYLTDAIEILKKSGKKVGAFKADFNEFMGVNSRVQLADANEVMRRRILEKHMNNGVTILNPNSTFIGVDVTIGADTIIYPGVIIEGKTIIGEDSIIGHNTRIVDSNIDNGVKIQSSVILESHIMEGANVGPFAYIRPDSVIGRDAKIGDFVEIKKSTIGEGTKVSHLTYIGDAEVGENCNFGCGTVFVNYDGSKKHKTVIGNNVFVGCNTNLVAPVTVEDDSYIAAGSTITEDVPKGSLAIARSKQVNKEGWVEKKGIWKK
ncbi:N-acetylglucosamine-1-phosphate uridyltransferase [Fervidicella metallireducens AeB]|uniref:Bifunctional protein GlmU n=1 Tax=Fervidicella metallireducens AeB TaxID=1403537 RepID=A0A017RTF5_9CLOT|nr:bifunctional UDP-N-acetylglucosamine diphosphorylase/glucosamine-1-phosphate N-acetyltransferase GlmU [Fervidicella metallireducens]EYE87891.1 N-acetylglucosamine-1-phosphate uridyltransferase [Fervidicella metallireducens AeB]